MIDTILFDLDGTLLQFSQEAFISAYFAELGKVFEIMGMDAGVSIKAVWAGTKAMMQNDGSQVNSRRFWAAFAEHLGLPDDKCRAVEAACDTFYVGGFNKVKAILTQDDISRRIVSALKSKGYGMVLATNPLFPACAIETRLKWIGLEPRDFLHVTDYSNSYFCKPNQGYYNAIFSKINKTPGQCLMVGNSPVEDMSAGGLGTETFLVIDHLENESGADVTAFRRGTLAQLERYLASLPPISQQPVGGY